VCSSDLCGIYPQNNTIFTTLLQNSKYLEMKLISLALAVFLIVMLSCRKDHQPEIPYVDVYYKIYPNTLDYIPVTGYKYLSQGYKGIVIYRVNLDQFNVFERCCPYDPEKANARIIVNTDGFTATDTVCKSTYSLYDGLPTGSGPSPYSLMQYHYSYDGDVLEIYN
jgi:hypothetical protein